MASDYGGNYRLHSTHILHAARVSQPQCFDGYIGQELGRVQHEHLHGHQHGLIPHPYPYPYPQPQFCLYPHPHPMSSALSDDEVLQREIEKERIRRDIIMSEILRRRALLEAEVRRDMMRETEMSLKRGGNGFSFGPPSTMGLDLCMSLPLAETKAEERFLDERSVSVDQRHLLNNTREGGRSEPLPFQRASNDVNTPRDSTTRDSEVKFASGGSNEKKLIILQAKPIKNITGVKRASSGSGASETQPDGNLKKKKKKKGEWSCALCKVIANSESHLNDHLKGKKHEKKEAALRRTQKTAKDSRIGTWTKEVAKHIQGSETSNPVTQVKLTSEPLPVGAAADGPRPLPGNPSSDNLKKDESVVTPRVQKKEAHRFWCEMCQVGVANQKIMNSHQRGRKHKHRLQNQAVEKTVAEVTWAVKKSEAKTVENDGVAARKTVAENQLTMVDVTDEKQLLS